MKKALLLSFIAFSLFSYGQSITNISTIKSNKPIYLNQGVFISATVDSAAPGYDRWVVHDASGYITCEFKNLTAPALNSQITIVGIVDDYNGIEIDVKHSWATANPPNYHTTIADIQAAPSNGDIVVLEGAITGILPGSNDDYFFEDATGTIEADWDILMNVPDLWANVELWGQIDYAGAYLDVDVWAWYYVSGAGLDELELNSFIYPNPVINEFAIDFPREFSNIKMFDCTGKIALDQEVVNNERIDVSAMASGTYIIWVYNQDELLGKSKLIIRK